mgnify:CR=1 FL=1
MVRIINMDDVGYHAVPIDRGGGASVFYEGANF